jgi:uncharacterized membrane protein YphA (DoxX/SURF4 family)
MASTERADLGPVALRVLALMLGVFFLAMGLNKLAWLTDSDVLTERFVRWVPTAAPPARWYLEHVAIPGAPLFARVVPLAELSAAAALILGIYIRGVAPLALAMVLNFHFATSAFFSWAFLRDGTGPPVIGALLALAIAGVRLPFCLTWPALRRDPSPVTVASAFRRKIFGLKPEATVSG